MMKEYLQIIKPGIIFSNLFSITGGFLLAAKGVINYAIFIATLLGVSLVIASSCIFNNYIDQDIDRIMDRTKNRPLVKGLINQKFCLIYAIILFISGIVLLYISTNILSIFLTFIGFIIYVGIYSLYMKRKSIYGTLIGSLSGATPPVIGYCSVSNQFDIGALILLLIFSLWQIPHSYAIAIFRFNDYQIANIPVLPVIKGIHVTKTHIFLYILAFMIATIMLTVSGYASYKYLIVAAIISLWWLCMAFSGFKNQNNDYLWARKVFIFSIIAITSLSIMMSIDSTAIFEQTFVYLK
ncbi:MAG: heme o synthase [Arsenophonus sp. ET-DL9-MAG3]